MRRLYWAIEINLVLWFLTLGILFQNSPSIAYKALVVIGFLFSAVFQHWAYYGIYKKRKSGMK